MSPLDYLTRVGNWYTPEGTGSPEASASLRALIAYNALFALQSHEVIYFSRRRDDEGSLLKENCSYEVTGTELPAHWWSLSIYDEEGFFPQNGLKNSIDQNALTAPWKVIISPEKIGETSWLSNTHAGDFNILLRLYVPRGDIHSMKSLPSIRRLSCRS
jgi:hypothetical protein